eukprot:Awhi_evm2s14737
MIDKFGKLRNFKGKALLDETAKENVWSVGSLAAEDDWKFIISGKCMQAKHPNGSSFTARLEDNIYYLDDQSLKINVKSYAVSGPKPAIAGSSSEMIYHRRFGHSSLQRIRPVLPKSITKNWTNSSLNCEICAEANMKRAPIRRKPKRQSTQVKIETVKIQFLPPTLFSNSLDEKKQNLETR